MPLIYVNYTSGAFSEDNLKAFASQITRDGVALEKMPLSDFVLSTTLVFTREFSDGTIFHGGKVGGPSILVVEFNVLQGGYSNTTKSELIKRVADAAGQYGDFPGSGPRRVTVIIREVAESNWGFGGETINLEGLRNPTYELSPL